MRIILLITILLLLPIIISASECSTSCIQQGQTSGTCKISSCQSYETKITGVSNCTLTGKAMLTLGEQAINTYKDQEPYIEEDETNPNWVWNLRRLDSNLPTNIGNTLDSTQHTGVTLGVQNKFSAKSIGSSSSQDALSAGGEICFPKSYICLKFDSLSVSNYSSYTVKYETTDLTLLNASWSSKPSILIQSIDDPNGLTLQIGTNTTTDKIWITHNNSDYISVVYENSNNIKTLAGYLQMTGNSRNIADINYQKTQNTDVQINLEGDTATQDNLNIKLDILGDKGLSKTDAYDDITFQLSHAASGDFDGLGDTPATSEESEIQWRTKNLGKKTNNLLSVYGIELLNPDTNGKSDRILFEIPSDQVKAVIKFTGTSTETSITTDTEKSYTQAQKSPTPELASQIDDPRNYNLILIGGPCANPLVTALFGITCVDWLLSPNEAMLKITKNKDNVALLIAGTTALDTKLAGDILIKSENLTGSSIKIQGVNYKTARINSLESSELNISDFPLPFVKNQNYNNLKVVLGDNARIEDANVANLILSELLKSTSEQITTSSNSTEQTPITSELEEEIPLGNNLADSGFFSNIIDSLALQSKQIKYQTASYDIEDKIMLFNNGPTIQTSLTASDDNYDGDPYLEIEAGELRYYYTFDEAIDLRSATSQDPLDIEFLRNDLSINSVLTSQIIVEKSDKYYLDAGQSLTINNKNIQLLNIEDNKILISLDNEKIILQDGVRQTINGITFKANAIFPDEKSNCCCFNVVDYFSK